MMIYQTGYAIDMSIHLLKFFVLLLQHLLMKKKPIRNIICPSLQQPFTYFN